MPRRREGGKTTYLLIPSRLIYGGLGSSEQRLASPRLLVPFPPSLPSYLHPSLPSYLWIPSKLICHRIPPPSPCTRFVSAKARKPASVNPISCSKESTWLLSVREESGREDRRVITQERKEGGREGGKGY